MWPKVDHRIGLEIFLSDQQLQQHSSVNYYMPNGAIIPRVFSREPSSVHPMAFQIHVEISSTTD